MESVLVALIGLGGLYTINNQEKREKMENKTDLLPQSTGNNTTLINTSDSTRVYIPDTQATSKYASQQQFKKEVELKKKVKAKQG